MTQKIGSLFKSRRTHQAYNMGIIVGVFVASMAACAKEIDEWTSDRISAKDEAKFVSTLNERESKIISFAEMISA